MDAEPESLPIGKGYWVKKGKDVTILAIGNRVHPAQEAAKLLREKGIDAGVVNMRFVKPLDTTIIKEALKNAPRLVTVEDNILAGGFGSAVAEFLTDKQMDFKLLRLGYPNEFVEHAKSSQLYRMFDLDDENMAKKILNWIQKWEQLWTKILKK